MDDTKEEIKKINVEISHLKVKDIQDMLKFMEKLRNTSGCDSEYMRHSHEVLEILWNHMEKGFTEFDDQLLCSTSFYAMLLHSNKKEYYLNRVLDLLNAELDLKENGAEVSTCMFNTISLIYGTFQSLILQRCSDSSVLATILKKAFVLLTLMAYEYSQYTFITFKIMTFFKKAVGTSFENILFNKENNLKLLNVINHNWENPITGVRSLNKIIFHNLISIIDESIYDLIEIKLKGFYWNKAKYLMLAEIIEHFPNNINLLLDKYDLLEGLTYSLKKTGLVSAGADMYVAILNKISTESDWSTIFLPIVTRLIKGSSIKPIENFNNYWCLNTLKKFPLLSRTIFDEINKLDCADNNLYSKLCIVQQSNRLGLLEKYFINSDHIEDLVSHNIDNNETHIRMVSFNILCGLHTKCFPTKKQFDLILNFLKNNINSDSTVLRISMLKSFENLLIQLHIAFANNRNQDGDMENLIIFCKELQHFIIKSLNFDGNYQRKVATIQITQCLLKSFKEIPRKKQKGTRQLQITLLDFIKSKNEWILSEKQFIFKLIGLLKDPSDDIREHVINVLMNNYSDQLCRHDILTYLIEEGLSCISSRFFYQTSCGQTIFKLILNILLTETCTEGRFKKVEDIFEFAYNEIKSECNSHLDIVKSIVEGRQLNSYINILHNIFVVSLETKYELNISIHVINSLIDLLRNVSNQFSWAQETSVSSDFSKMNDMVQKMIDNSEHKISHQYNETNISGLHQIVLNCLWLNVKASCELSSILIQYYKDDSYHEVCDKCLKLICNVLETSRHKGAIEAGGATLGKAIQQLTSLSGSSVISNMPMSLLKLKLKQLVLETSNMASVTRRGAGLSIMIHRIVSSDMKKGKPLFHYFIQTLLETCNDLPDRYSYESDLEKNNERDLPKAVYIHFLTKIVTDSSLASDMMYYSDKLAKLAFDNLSSSCWQIRNAALQLYGSLIPKIIGQKKNSGASEEVTATVAVDEFRSHSPKLWEYIEKQLEISTKLQYDIVQCHNNLVPILSILANLAPFYTFGNEMDYKENLLPSLLSLLGSPIYVIRQLAPKCILNIYPFETILDFLLNCTCNTENSLHGTLTLLHNFSKQYNIEFRKEIASILKNKFNSFMIRKCSYLSKEKFESTFPDCISLNNEMIHETLSETCINRTCPGIFLWENFRIKLYLERAPWDKIPQIVTLISTSCNFDTYCEILCKRIEHESFVDEEVLLEISKYLFSMGFTTKCTIIWKTLFEISLQSNSLINKLDSSLLYKYLLDNEIIYRMRYMIVFATRIFIDTATEELLYLSGVIYNMCWPEMDVDMRLIAAMANNELADKFDTVPDSIKINAIKTAIVLLQDEDEDVRNLSVHFYRKVNKNKIAVHPYVSWQMILNHEFLNKTLTNPQSGIQCICNDLMDLLKSLKIDSEDEYNPFANDSKNVYLEIQVVKLVLNDLQKYN